MGVYKGCDDRRRTSWRGNVKDVRKTMKEVGCTDGLSLLENWEEYFLGYDQASTAFSRELSLLKRIRG